MKPLTLIALVVILALSAALSASPAEAATANITRNPNSTAHRSTVNGQFNGININVSTANMPNVTACVVNFTNNLSNDHFTVNITNGEGGGTISPGSGSASNTINGSNYLNLTSAGTHTLNFSTRVDGNWTITGRCFNHTASGANSTAGGVGSWNETITETTFILDTRRPTAPSNVETVDSDAEEVSVRATVVANGTTNCTVWMSIDGIRFSGYAMTHATNATTCTFTQGNIYDPGDLLRYIIEASDLTNKTNSSTTTIELLGGGFAQAVASARQAQLTEAARQAQIAITARNAEIARRAEVTTSTKSSNTKLILVIGGVLVVLGYTQGWFGKKKRR